MLKISAQEFLKISKAKKNKYRNKATVIDGVRFDSKGEAEEWANLEKLERDGEIRALRTQVRFPFKQLKYPGGKTPTYIADFVFEITYKGVANNFPDYKAGQIVVRDYKGMRKGAAWQMFQLKAALMKRDYGIDVEVVP